MTARKPKVRTEEEWREELELVLPPTEMNMANCAMSAPWDPRTNDEAARALLETMLSHGRRIDDLVTQLREARDATGLAVEQRDRARRALSTVVDQYQALNEGRAEGCAPEQVVYDIFAYGRRDRP